MKALIRNDGEIITEDMNIQGIDWNTGMPLTSPYWAGGAYTLIENFIPPTETETEKTETEKVEDIEKQKRIEALEKELSELKNK